MPAMNSQLVELGQEMEAAAKLLSEHEAAVQCVSEEADAAKLVLEQAIADAEAKGGKKGGKKGDKGAAAEEGEVVIPPGCEDIHEEEQKLAALTSTLHIGRDTQASVVSALNGKMRRLWIEQLADAMHGEALSYSSAFQKTIVSTAQTLDSHRAPRHVLVTPSASSLRFALTGYTAPVRQDMHAQVKAAQEARDLTKETVEWAWHPRTISPLSSLSLTSTSRMTMVPPTHLDALPTLDRVGGGYKTQTLHGVIHARQHNAPHFQTTMPVPPPPASLRRANALTASPRGYEFSAEHRAAIVPYSSTLLRAPKVRGIAPAPPPLFKVPTRDNQGF